MRVLRHVSSLAWPESSILRFADGSVPAPIAALSSGTVSRPLVASNGKSAPPIAGAPVPPIFHCDAHASEL